jgi:CDP-glycerol glycerophosphotransferase (TagB/SpsB family)
MWEVNNMLERSIKITGSPRYEILFVNNNPLQILFPTTTNWATLAARQKYIGHNPNYNRKK